jgi:hypothetical protein
MQNARGAPYLISQFWYMSYTYCIMACKRIYNYVISRQILLMIYNYNVVNILTNPISLTWSTQLWKPFGKLPNDIDTFRQNAILHLNLDVVNNVNGSSQLLINAYATINEQRPTN